jgi:type IV secretory pathway VirJ component
LVSTKFKQWYAALDEDDQDAINAIIDIDNWAQKIRNSPEVVKQTKGILAELGL